MVAENFQHEKTIREKYNAETRTTEAQVSAGYQQNVVGFGWTNGVFELLAREQATASARHNETTPR
jgi:neutral trehalase